MRLPKLPRQVDSSKLDCSAMIFSRYFADGGLPSESCARWAVQMRSASATSRSRTCDASMPLSCVTLPSLVQAYFRAAEDDPGYSTRGFIWAAAAFSRDPPISPTTQSTSSSRLSAIPSAIRA